MRYVLDLGTGPLVACQSAAQALALARVFVALTTGRPATNGAGFPPLSQLGTPPMLAPPDAP